MTPFVLRRDPWNREAMRRDVFTHGLWQFRSGTGNFPGQESTWPCGTSVVEPAASLYGDFWVVFCRRRQRTSSTSRVARRRSRRPVAEGLEAGFDVFYLKVGLDDTTDLEMVSTVREQLGPGPLLRIDVNGSWTIPQALRNLRAMSVYDIDFVEQPVRDHPVGQLAEVRARIDTAVCANEGLWSEADAYARIRARDADVYCLSPTGSDRSAAFTGSAGSCTSKGFRSASTPTGSWGSRRQRAIMCS